MRLSAENLCWCEGDVHVGAWEKENLALHALEEPEEGVVHGQSLADKTGAGAAGASGGAVAGDELIVCAGVADAAEETNVLVCELELEEDVEHGTILVGKTGAGASGAKGGEDAGDDLIACACVSDAAEGATTSWSSICAVAAMS